MRFLIENSETREFLTAAGHWSKNPGEGKIFISSAAALTAVGLAAIRKFNLVFLDSQANPYLKLNYR